MKACLIHEFAPHVDYQRKTVYEALKQQYPETTFYSLHGFLSKYIEGGMHPLRLLNMVWVFLKIPLHLVLRRPCWILCGTAPPCIQVWASWWAGLLKIPIVAWIFDYHPEIEVRAMERRALLKPIGAILRWLDRTSQKSLKGVIVLDEAMANIFQEVSPKAKVVIHPTWNEYKAAEDSSEEPKDPEIKPNKKELTLAYAGNLGARHPLHLLEKVLKKMNELSPEIQVLLHVISSNEMVKQRFRYWGGSLDLRLEFHERVPTLEDLKTKFAQLGTDYGIILMEEEAQGLLSPSKYSGYLHSGLPLLYCGPRFTNADAICRKFGAGVAVTTNDSDTEVQDVATKLLNQNERIAHKATVTKAYQHYMGFSSTTFLAVLRSLINPSNGGPPENQ